MSNDTSDSPLTKGFRGRLLTVMGDAGVTQAGLARSIGVEPGVVNRWCCGKNLPRCDALVRLVHALGVPYETLLGTREELLRDGILP